MEIKDFSFKIIDTVRWHWNQHEFSFMNMPRPNHGFLTVISGRVDYIIDNRVISLSAGDFIYLPKNSVYKAKFHITEGSVETLLVNFDFFDNDIFPITPFYNSADPSLQIETALEKLHTLRSDELYLQKAYFYLCLHLFYKSFSEQNLSIDSEFILSAKALLQSESLSVEDVAKKLSVSNSYFRKKFKDAVGISPSEWRIQKRIETARSLISTTELSISEIALQTGFYDTPYFYKKFYQYMGITPKKYRDSKIMF